MEFQIAKPKGGGSNSFTAPNERLGAGDQLTDVEVFVEVVVGSRVEELDDRGPFAACCKNKDRRMIPASTDATKYCRAIDFGKHKVKNNEVVAEMSCQVECRLAVLGMVYRKAWTVTQGERDVFSQADLVFDKQHTHKTISTYSA
jgi:hypothetical protein